MRFEVIDRLPTSAEEAWRIVADVHHWNEWTDQIRPVHGSSIPIEVGTRILIHSRMPLWPFSPLRGLRINIEIEKCVPGQAFVWTGRAMGVRGRHGFEFKPIDANSCEVTQWEELWGWQTWLVRVLGLWRNLKRSFPLLLNQLRNHISRHRLDADREVVELDGAKMSYLDTGTGEPVVMLHGYPQSHYCWRHQIAEFMDFSRLIVPDLLGWGASDRPLDTDYQYESEVGRLILFIEGLGLDRVHLVAHDYGGYLALGMAKRKPELLKSLVILNSRAHGIFKWRWKWLFILTLRWLSQIPVFGKLVKWLPVRPFHKFILRREFRLGLFDAHAEESYFGHFDPGSIGNEWLFQFFAPGKGYSFVPDRALLKGHSEELPTLVIWGTLDRFLSTNIAEELSSHLPNCQLKLLPNAGHYVMEEAPNEVSAALREFLFPAGKGN